MNIDRSTFISQLNAELTRAEKKGRWLGLLVVDIKDFRAINRTFGFQCGDQLLAHCYQQLKKIAARPDLLYRLGNDEFTLLLPDLTSPNETTAIGQLAARAVNADFFWQGEAFNIRANVGATAATKRSDFEALILTAEHALAGAKSDNLDFKTETLGNILPKDIDASLYIAFKNALKGNQLALHYQPKLSRHDTENLYAEALLRWQRPGHGFIPPDKFLPVCERLGLNVELNRWVINEALRQQNAWPNSNQLNIAINLSADIIDLVELPDIIEEALGRWQADPASITIEITESAIIGDKKSAFANLLRLREIGIKVSIDDFGTGYSSLEYFKDIPADELKVDRSFISQIESNSADKKIVKLIIDLAHAFNLSVVAEGIESITALHALVDMQCDFSQGFLLAKPMPMDELIHWQADSAQIQALSKPAAG